MKDHDPGSSQGPGNTINFPPFRSESEYRDFLQPVSTLPEGFRVSTARLAFTPSERPTLEPYRMNMGLILAEKPTESFAGVFTRNSFPGAPVIVGRERMHETLIRGILINNKIANVRAKTGIKDAHTLTRTLGQALELPESQLLSVSTGIIGWKLPVSDMVDAFPELVSGLHAGPALDLADAIMTTDSFPKVRRIESGGGSILGIAKGAGMIEPNMATMLVFILTDLAVERETLRAALTDAVDHSFNRISVDSDMSTSDMALLISSGTRKSVSDDDFRTALNAVCGSLAEDIVRNGEGTGHVVRVSVDGCPSSEFAREASKAIVNSPLVKTAIYGNDPNVGRILSALGDFAGKTSEKLDPESIVIEVGAEVVYRNGAFEIDREKEIRLSEYLGSSALNPRLTGYPQHQRSVDINLHCHAGTGSGFAIGADLSDQYVRENADYRT